MYAFTVCVYVNSSTLCVRGVCVWMCTRVSTGAMGLPVSGFPNMNAVALEDGTGQTYVNTADFLAVGVPSSFAAFGVIISLGYVLMYAVGF